VRGSGGGRNETSGARSRTASAGGSTTEVRNVLNQWLDATNSGDFDRQARFYGSRVSNYYGKRNFSRRAVLADKRNRLGGAQAVNLRAEKPRIQVSPDGRTATLRYRKPYSIVGGKRPKSGVVNSELRLEREGGEWKIVGERDLGRGRKKS